MAEHPIEKMINSGIDYLIRENTADSWAEAIAIIIANMKDEKGLFCMPRLHDDYAEHIRLCKVLASTLRMFIDSSILASIPPNQPPLVRLDEFLKLIKGNENFIGIPTMRTEWPTREKKE